MNFPRKRPDFFGKKTGETETLSYSTALMLNEPAIECIEAEVIDNEEVEYLEASEIPNNRFSFEISVEPVFVGKNRSIAPDHNAIINDQTGEVLNLCSKKYTPINNTMFTDFIEELSYQTGFEIGKTIEVDGGRKLAGYLILPEERQEFNFKNYMIVGNSHDSSTGLFLGFSSLMVRCSNQFTPKMRSIQIYHRPSAPQKMALITATISNFFETKKTTLKQFDKMLNTKMSYQKTEFAKIILGIDRHEEPSTRKTNQLEQLEQCIDTEILDIGKNNFALFNGVTRFTTHEIESKTTVFGNWRGVKNELNNKALELCLA